MKLEACIETFEEARIAAKHKIDRVELCSALDLGGLTPSAALIKNISEQIETHVMIRPRAGGFVYTKSELLVMDKDIQIAKKLGATGVVFGCLTDTKEIDVESNSMLFEKVRSLGLVSTFHRAFDFLFDLDSGITQLIDMGFDRVLTSGGQLKAYSGLNQIMKLITLANGKIEIMAGSGVNADNIKTIKAAGVDAAHFSIRKKQVGMASLNMGEQYEIDEEKILTIMSLLS
jgi:copper homeostasis protein